VSFLRRPAEIAMAVSLYEDFQLNSQPAASAKGGISRPIDGCCANMGFFSYSPTCKDGLG